MRGTVQIFIFMVLFTLLPNLSLCEEKPSLRGWVGFDSEVVRDIVVNNFNASTTDYVHLNPKLDYVEPYEHVSATETLYCVEFFVRVPKNKENKINQIGNWVDKKADDYAVCGEIYWHTCRQEDYMPCGEILLWEKH